MLVPLTFNSSVFFYTNPKNRTTDVTIKQITIPVTVGIRKESPVHFQLWVSFFIVKQVVLHGQCINENNITFTAVSQVHPLAINSCLSCVKLSNSTKLPVAV